MSTKSTKEKALNFEQATGRLEAIVERIEAPDTGLEEMIALVEEGLGLINRSRKLLAEAELKIRRLEEPQASTPKTDTQDDGFSLI